MIELIGVNLPKGKAILLTADVGGAVSDLNNPNHTIVYTDTFVDGLTIDMPISEFYDLWMSCLTDELSAIEVELASEEEE
jgi:hypothetical protein